MTSSELTEHLLFLWLGFLVGGLLAGFLSDRLGRPDYDWGAFAGRLLTLAWGFLMVRVVVGPRL